MTTVSKKTNPLAFKLVKRLLVDYTRPYLSTLFLGILLMIVVAASSVAPAKLIEPIIDDIFVARNADMLVPVTLAVFFVFLIKGIATYGESVTLAYVGQRIIADIQKHLFRHLIHCDLEFFHNNPSGGLVSHFTNDVNKLNSAITGSLTSMGKDGLTLVFFIILMFYQDWVLASISLFVLPIAIFPVVRIGKRLRKVSTNIQQELGEFTILLTQAFQGMRLVKSYCMEKYETSKAFQAIEKIFERTLKATRVRSAAHPIMEFLGGVAIMVVIFYGGTQVIYGHQNPGAFFSFITALIMTYEPLKRLANLNSNLQEQLAAAQRVFALIDSKPNIKDAKNATNLMVKKGHITFQDVFFSYLKRKNILRAITLDIPAGKTTALVGPSGGGKSTLMNLLLRFYESNEGKIFIDGKDITKVTLKSLRDSIALVSQDIILFNDTVRENITFGKPGASEKDIIKAAEAAAAHSFISELPEGYNTIIGEQGVKLSGGQRQRISIARAFLKNAPILLLDEPTSALDSESEEKVQQALSSLMKGRTTLIIAHRLATVIGSDIIYLVDKGKIIASGKHQALLKSSDKYARLCRSQLRKQSEG
jgi:subfamily B ATP-binding cassette protein MsbA